jgi:hypothetical protein
MVRGMQHTLESREHFQVVSDVVSVIFVPTMFYQCMHVWHTVHYTAGLAFTQHLWGERTWIKGHLLCITWEY